MLMSILLSAEMEVDGNLKLTGKVESATIDSLKARIAELILPSSIPILYIIPSYIY